MKVVVGSKNPVKLKATEAAFALAFPEQTFEFIACDAPSQVADQPMDIAETKTGAYNRCQSCRKNQPIADYWVGLEGGLEIIDGGYWVSAWMCVQDKTGRLGYGRTSAFLLPPAVTKLIQEGVELGKASDIVFGETNSGYKSGTVAFLTGGKIHRSDFYRDAIMFALIPFQNEHLYNE